MAAVFGDDDSVPFAVHLQPTLHFDVESEAGKPFEAQARALKQFADFIAEANERDDIDVPFEVERLDLGGVQPNAGEMMQGALGLDDEHGVPPEDTRLDVDPSELDAMQSFEEALDELDGDDDDDVADTPAE